MTVKTFLGDCLDILPTLEEGTVDMILCDLPYGTTQNKWDTPIPLEPLWTEWKRVRKPGAPTVLFGQQPFTSVLGCSNIDELRYEWIYEKGRPTGFLNANRAPLKSHEDILVFYGRAPIYNPIFGPKTEGLHISHSKTSPNYGDYDHSKTNPDLQGSYPRTIIHSDERGRIHATQKPVDVCEYLIRTYTDEGMTVLDSCMGSGTTGVACVRANRDFIGIEKDPTYYAKAVERIASAEPAAKPRTTLDDYHSESCTEGA